jgi:hypothetical protein
VKKKQALPIYGNVLIYHDEAQTRQCQLFLERLAQVSKHQPDSKKFIPFYPTFTRTWRKHFSHLKITKEYCLGCCDVCEKLSEKIKKSHGQKRDRYLTQKA